MFGAKGSKTSRRGTVKGHGGIVGSSLSSSMVLLSLQSWQNLSFGLSPELTRYLSLFLMPGCAGVVALGP